MRAGARDRVVALVTVMLLTLAARVLVLDRASASAPFQPSFETVPCPPDVTDRVDQDQIPPNVLTCGYLTVLENRSDPSQGTIRLFVLQAAPASGQTPPDPIFITGRELVGRSPWALPFGYRVGRVTMSMDRRGAGRSEPSLVCPEVRQLTSPSAGIVLGSDQMTSALLDAVEACHDRLSAEGVDLSSYNVAEMAADAEDLRVALGIDEWNLLSYGTASAISFEILRRYPEHVRSATFDSPLPPTVDRFTQAIEGTEYAFDQVVAACTARPSCDQEYPHLHAAWRQALHRLDEGPSTFRDEDLDVVVDDATAVRYLRNNLALGVNETQDISEFPLAIYQLRDHGWENGGPAGNEVGWASTPPMYVGYEVQWGDPGALHAEALAGRWVGRPSEGTFYSYMCEDEVPFVDEKALEQAADARPWYVDAYVKSPYPEICDRWEAIPAGEDPHTAMTSVVPILTFSGRFDPYSNYPLVEQGTAGFANRTILRVPARSRNALSVECTAAIRDAFVTDPGTQPDTSCLSEIHEGYPVSFAPPQPPTRAPRRGDAVISTVAGDGAVGSSGDGDLAAHAQVIWPVDLATAPSGDLYLMDWLGDRVRRVDESTARISTAVGPPTGIDPPPPGDASTVELHESTALAIDADGNLYVGGGDGTHRMILRVDPLSGEVVRVAGTGEKGDTGDGGPAIDATMSWVRDIAADANGNIYFTDFLNHRIRKIDTSGIITSIAGTGKKGFSGDGGPATQARLNLPSGLALEGHGTIYFADRGNNRVRRLGPHGHITTVAGTGARGYEGDGGPALEADLGTPLNVLVDARGDLFITSVDCACVRMVDTHGLISTIAGTGVPGFSGDGGPAIRARLSCCADGMVLGPDGALYIADGANHRVRKVVFP